MPLSIEQELAEIKRGDDSTRQFKTPLTYPNQITSLLITMMEPFTLASPIPAKSSASPPRS